MLLGYPITPTFLRRGPLARPSHGQDAHATKAPARRGGRAGSALPARRAPASRRIRKKRQRCYRCPSKRPSWRWRGHGQDAHATTYRAAGVGLRPLSRGPSGPWRSCRFARGRRGTSIRRGEELNSFTPRRQGARMRQVEVLCLLSGALRFGMRCFALELIASHVRSRWLTEALLVKNHLCATTGATSGLASSRPNVTPAAARFAG